MNNWDFIDYFAESVLWLIFIVLAILTVYFKSKITKYLDKNNKTLLKKFLDDISYLRFIKGFSTADVDNLEKATRDSEVLRLVKNYRIMLNIAVFSLFIVLLTTAVILYFNLKG